jgi:hypothetical protein
MRAMPVAASMAPATESNHYVTGTANGLDHAPLRNEGDCFSESGCRGKTGRRGHPRSAIPDRTSLLAQIRLFGVGHGVGKGAGRENRLAIFKGAWSRWADTLAELAGEPVDMQAWQAWARERGRSSADAS